MLHLAGHSRTAHTRPIRASPSLIIRCLDSSSPPRHVEASMRRGTCLDCRYRPGRYPSPVSLLFGDQEMGALAPSRPRRHVFLNLRSRISPSYSLLLSMSIGNSNMSPIRWRNKNQQGMSLRVSIRRWTLRTRRRAEGGLKLYVLLRESYSASENSLHKGTNKNTDCHQ